MNSRIIPYLLLSLAVLLIAPWIGTEHIGLDHLLSYLGGDGNPGGSVLIGQRIPRVLLGFLAGGTLALVGASFQVLFRNPLVEPYTLGVTGGAALGAYLAIAFPALSVPVGPLSSMQFMAMVGAGATLGIIYFFARQQQGLSTHTLLLAGVTLGIVCGGAIMLLTYISDPHKLLQINRWLMGGIDVVGYKELATILPFLLPGLGLLLANAPELNHIALGEEMATGHGVDVNRVQTAVFVGGGLATAMVVSLVGPIGFVGLIVPHAVRRMSGFDQRLVLPASFLLGGAALTAADCVARSLFMWLWHSTTELPVGIITALVGGPLFIRLLLSRKFMT
jgi:iron complex transport system permease protein